MTSSGTILFIQRRSTRAGAQTSLFRLVKSSVRKTIVVCAEEGWLEEQLPNSLVRYWPSPRSLYGRLGGLKAFSKKLSSELTEIALVVANDHQECPVALALSKALGVPCVVILRSSGMSQRDYEKYRTNECDHLFIVGDELARKATHWSKVPQSMFSEGFLEDEFLPVPENPNKFPSQILVAGSEAPGKGFQDFLQSLAILQAEQPDFPIKKVAFTGRPPECELPKLNCELDFVGRVQDFATFARKFDLAVHPSRHETFGLAPLELIIAGVPTLCTRTGITRDDLLPASWLTDPRSPEQMAEALLDWCQNWQERRKELPEVIGKIHSRFTISKTSSDFFEKIDQLSDPTRQATRNGGSRTTVAGKVRDGV